MTRISKSSVKTSDNQTSTISTATSDLPKTREVTLNIEGMNCSSCVSHIEKKIETLPEAKATVNLALNNAIVTVPAHISNEELIKKANSSGYTSTLAKDSASLKLSDDSNISDSDSKDHTHSSDNSLTNEHSQEKEATSPHEHGGISHLKARLLISAALTIPVVLISMIPTLRFENWQWVVFALTTPIVLWCAWPFHKGAFKSLRYGHTTMDTLVSIGILAAYIYSTYSLIQVTVNGTLTAENHNFTYFEVCAVVTTFLLLGKYLEARATEQSAHALESLLNLGAKHATVLLDYKNISEYGFKNKKTSEKTAPVENFKEKTIPIEQLRVGDVFLVKPGEKVPTDGKVLQGHSSVDKSMLTGESIPVDIDVDDEIIGGTINNESLLVARAQKVGSDTVLAHMADLVTKAQNTKTKATSLADKISSIFVPVVLIVSLLTFVAWLFIGHSFEKAFLPAIAVLIVACPCALGLATPAALLSGIGRGAQLGIVIKGADILEDTRKVDTIVLDKTGTVTTGKMTVSDIVASQPFNHAEVLSLAAGIEKESTHPIAQAVMKIAKKQHVIPQKVFETTNFPGEGLSGRVVFYPDTESQVRIGRADFVRVPIPEKVSLRFRQLEDEGKTALWVGLDNQLVGLIALEDQVKDTAAETISKLTSDGMTPILLTGDNQSAADNAAHLVGIETVHASAMPEDKLNMILSLQKEGQTVAMAGDGINDTAPLAAADVSIAMGTGSDAAIEASDITITNGDISKIDTAIRLSYKTLKIIRENLFWAFAYNVIAIPVAALGWMHPMIAGAAMAFSSVFVVANSLRLKWFK